MAEYKIGKRARVCCVCGEAFEPGDRIVSAIYQGLDGQFERRDMREVHFDPASQPFCHWRSTEPHPTESPHKLDYDLALSFFDRLRAEADPARDGLVYTLTLLLSRKRRVKIEASRRLPEGDLLRVRVRRAEEDDEVSVRAPRLSDADVDGLQAELEKLFDFGGNGASRAAASGSSPAADAGAASAVDPGAASAVDAGGAPAIDAGGAPAAEPDPPQDADSGPSQAVDSN